MKVFEFCSNFGFNALYSQIEFIEKCYKEGRFTETEKETCYGDFVLKDGKCIRSESYKAEGVCEEGDYNYTDDKCHVRTYTGDAKEYCRDISWGCARGRIYEENCNPEVKCCFVTIEEDKKWNYLDYDENGNKKQ